MKILSLLPKPLRRKPVFRKSSQYWQDRYVGGGNSGSGSYGHLAEFKARVLNQFVELHEVRTVLEFGCGDGNQLELATYPNYLGVDVAPAAVELCQQRFQGVPTRRFMTLESFLAGKQGPCDLTLSLDVIYHLIEDSVYFDYMQRLFACARRFVIVYASNMDQQASSKHVRHRRFTDWVSAEAPAWELFDHMPNEFAYRRNDGKTSFSEFFFFKKR